jgi:uncharacterized protein (TIGR02118 family)
MIKVSVLYPWTPGASFDMDYYCTQHMALVRKRFGKAVKGVAVDEGLAGETATSKPPYAAIGHVLFETLEDLQKAFAAHGEAIMADISNYTTIEPIIQISEVRL